MASATSRPALPRSKTNTAPASHVSATITSDQTPPEDALPAADNPNFAHPTHVIPPPNHSRFEDLIIVCCHAIYLPDADSPSFPLQSPYDERNWLLAPFQISDPATGKPGEHPTFLAHAQAGLDALTICPSNNSLEKNLLILSGGVTKSSTTPMSEARSYYNACLANGLASGHLGGGKARSLFNQGRILLEEHATDSLQNLLFSILLFRRTTGHYPRHIRIISHAFKARRILELHAPALRWPEKRIQVQGIDPVMSMQELDATLEGEERFGYALWEGDALGKGEKLSRKRRERGWDGAVVEKLVEGLEAGVREVVEGEMPERLPWEEREHDV
ncbi:hypothetical protein DE146DRAFT_51643 [Phaeosphaeria sp. MPI-PUGE-AT-0046c]|nr:hypothetical protein DE146DRAFT_51643 [Phaeosphaeria sp. MPI-PUGE-AT-0046c]